MAAWPVGRMSSPSYSSVSPQLTRWTAPSAYDGPTASTPRSNAMNTIIYIVGLVVVIGFILSFFGLR